MRHWWPTALGLLQRAERGKIERSQRSLIHLPSSYFAPRSAQSNRPTSSYSTRAMLRHIVREEDTDDFAAVDGCRNRGRDGDRLHTWPDLADSVGLGAATRRRICGATSRPHSTSMIS